MPWTSAGRDRVYFLDGATRIEYLDLNGGTGSVTQVAITSNQEAGFSVSPDGKRIAVTIFSYSLSPSLAFDGMRLYVEDLQGGANHVEIYSSPNVAEYPIGWTADSTLIVAVSTPTCCDSNPDQQVNPYGAIAYHVVDPANGNRLVALCEGTAGPVGPIEPVGTMCDGGGPGGGPSFWHWTGTPFPAPSVLPFARPDHRIVISPDGSGAAGVMTAGGDGISLARNGPRGGAFANGQAYGWLDATHLIFLPTGKPTMAIYDFARTSEVLLPIGTSYFGPLPPHV